MPAIPFQKMEGEEMSRSKNDPAAILDYGLLLALIFLVALLGIRSCLRTKAPNPSTPPPAGAALVQSAKNFPVGNTWTFPGAHWVGASSQESSTYIHVFEVRNIGGYVYISLNQWDHRSVLDFISQNGANHLTLHVAEPLDQSWESADGSKVVTVFHQLLEIKNAKGAAWHPADG